jgi:hypothetical protein
MAESFSGESNESPPTPFCPPPETPPLARAADDLGRLARQLNAIQAELADYAPQRHNGAMDWQAALVRIEQKLDRLTGSPTSPFAGDAAGVAKTPPPAAPAREQAHAAEFAEPPASVEQDVPENRCAAAPWEQVFFPDELGQNADIEPDRQALLAAVLRGEPRACGLAARLLLLHGATAESFPHLMRDVGEAYYRWRPKTTDQPASFEQSLADWLEQRAEAAGARHRIELVRPGERYNAQRHRALGRGVEVTEVQGWIILREDASVFQKASVGLK